jgi:hypothetical protein
MNALALYFTAQLALGLFLITLTARLLARHGRAVLLHAYHGQEPMANATAFFLVAGYCLLNGGLLAFTLNAWPNAITPEEGLTNFLTRVGFFCFILAGTLYGNLHYLNTVRWDNLYFPKPPLLTK